VGYNPSGSLDVYSHQIWQAKMTEQDDATRCGICGEPFKDGEIAVQAMRPLFSTHVQRSLLGEKEKFEIRTMKPETFWAHAVCVFTVAGETEEPSEKHKPSGP
jgi:hypothetical protein